MVSCLRRLLEKGAMEIEGKREGHHTTRKRAMPTHPSPTPSSFRHATPISSSLVRTRRIHGILAGGGGLDGAP